ncbi:MAG: hypothetical protein J5I98_35455 [Phaeodactylibacter sp.]|nr:hypothetical protein [Phaeodactylibacter sp.]
MAAEKNGRKIRMPGKRLASSPGDWMGVEKELGFLIEFGFYMISRKVNARKGRGRRGEETRQKGEENSHFGDNGRRPAVFGRRWAAN